MRVRVVEISFEEEGARPMADWIDRRKKVEQERDRTHQRQQDILLHKADVLRAKLPLFVQILKDSIKRDAKKLTAQFPDNRRRRCNLEERGEYAFLVGTRVPRK